MSGQRNIWQFRGTSPCKTGTGSTEREVGELFGIDPFFGKDGLPCNLSELDETTPSNPIDTDEQIRELFRQDPFFPKENIA